MFAGLMERFFKNESRFASNKFFEKSRNTESPMKGRLVEDPFILLNNKPAEINRNQLFAGKLFSAQGNNMLTTTAIPITSYTNPTAFFKADESLFKDMSTEELNEMLEIGGNQPSPPEITSQKPNNKFANLLPALFLGLASKNKSNKSQMIKEREQELRKKIGHLFG